MNTEILRKCLLELERKEPRLDYIRGMLETLIEMQWTPKIPASIGAMQTEKFGVAISSSDTTDEGAILDARAKAAMAQVKALGLDNPPLE